MKKYYSIILLLLLAMVGCKKESEWLDVKSNKSDVVPATLQDYQALMDNDRVMNEGYGALCIGSADNMYIQYPKYQALANAQDRNAHVWNDAFYNGEPGFDWRSLYAKVGQANIVLDGIEKLGVSSNDPIYRNLKGSALFYRAFSFYNLIQEFTLPYTNQTADKNAGIILKLTSAVQEKTFRSNIHECYGQIIRDLDEAELLLPSVQPYKTRPTTIAVKALKARMYLAMSDYRQASIYAKAVLAQFNTLLDYNTINGTVLTPFPKYQTGNPEIMFFCMGTSSSLTVYNTMLIDPEIYSQYDNNDLRKTLFYRDNGINGITFRGSYTADVAAQFQGSATNELMLINSECEARAGNKDAALTQLNALLVKRFKTGTFVPITANNADEALSIVLRERRKELPFTGNLRWEDLRRLNQEARFQKTLTRILNGVTYTLEPNSVRYALPIPDDEIRISGIEQNVR